MSFARRARAAPRRDNDPPAHTPRPNQKSPSFLSEKILGLGAFSSLFLVVETKKVRLGNVSLFCPLYPFPSIEMRKKEGELALFASYSRVRSLPSRPEPRRLSPRMYREIFIRF